MNYINKLHLDMLRAINNYYFFSIEDECDTEEEREQNAWIAEIIRDMFIRKFKFDPEDYIRDM